jgi:acetyl esterase/lipase
MFAKIFITAALLYSVNSLAQETVALYTKVPNAVSSDLVTEKADTTSNGRIRVSKVTQPTMTVFLPEKKIANGVAVIICPGGGYSYLVMNQEGTDVAREFVKQGIAAFVLKYRLPDDRIMQDKSVGPLQDAQQAIRMVRQRAKEWNIDTSKVGIMGFSAGGHLASTASTHFKDVTQSTDNIDLRPSFSILVYPVISFTDSLAHKGSRKALLGASPSSQQMDLFSNEKQVTPHTPPTFLIHCGDDKVVSVKNSLAYYDALLRNGVRAELHIYPTGGHGFGLNNKAVADRWFDRCINWLQARP